MAATVPNCPRGRTEEYLASIAGLDIDKPSEPWSREEAYLDAIDGRLDGIEEDVETLKNNPDVVDIVDTYADLQAYDKTKLTDNDIIRVLNDETHDGESTYYRYSAATQTFTYIGTTKQYTNFVGTDGTTAGEAGLVPAPATTDAGKFLKADGTWDDAGSPVNVVQTTGTSTTDVMSQNAVTSMVYTGDKTTKRQIAIGGSTTLNVTRSTVVIGENTFSNGEDSVAIGPGHRGGGDGARVYGTSSIAIGRSATSSASGGIALGAFSNASVAGTMDIGSTDTSYGYSGSNYRLLTGLYDGQSAHDAATKGQLDTAVINGGTTAPTTSTVGVVGTIYSYVDTAGGVNTPYLMVCTNVDTSGSVPVYTWSNLPGVLSSVLNSANNGEPSQVQVESSLNYTNNNQGGSI